jgi:hypothetical protein
MKAIVLEIIWYMCIFALGALLILSVHGGTPRENTVLLSHRLTRQSGVTNGCIVFPPLKYPADMTNFTWMLQRSHDLTNWENLQYFPQKGLPQGSYCVQVTNPPVFFRMLEMP